MVLTIVLVLLEENQENGHGKLHRPIVLENTLIDTFNEVWYNDKHNLQKEVWNKLMLPSCQEII